jgi:hypothetical protein
VYVLPGNRGSQRVKFVAHLGISNRAQLDAAQKRRLRVGSAAPESAMAVGRIHEADVAKPDVGHDLNS